MCRPLQLLIIAVLVATPVRAETLLLFNGRILVAADAASDQRWAGALLIQNGRVLDVGRESKVRLTAAKLGYKPVERDLKGAYAMPGLIDAHGHVASLGFAMQRLRLAGTTSAEQIAEMVAAAAKSRAADEWILGRGWDQNDWAVKKFPTHELLDAAAPQHFVWLRRVDGHAGWANARALARAGITRRTPDPPGGRLERSADGTPTGVLVDNAMSLIEDVIPRADRAQTHAAIMRATEACARLGLTGVHDAGIDTLQLSVYRALAETGELPIRVSAMLSASTALLPGMLPKVKSTAGDGTFRVFAVKAYADGALGSRGAALLEPYSDDPGNRGLLVTTPDTLELIAHRCLAAGYPMCTHAIGDRGNRVALDAYARAAGGDAKLAGKRFRIEHAQTVALQDIPRFAKAGIIASMQPTHCTSDMPWAPARLGTKRIEGAYAWRRMLKAGVRLALGSDFPVEDAAPRLGLYAAITTQDPSGQPPAGGYRATERLTIREALRGFTSDAAYAAFMEREVGRLELGYRADITVFDRDLTAIPAAELLEAKCLLTIVGGRTVWDARP